MNSYQRWMREFVEILIYLGIVNFLRKECEFYKENRQFFKFSYYQRNVTEENGTILKNLLVHQYV